LVSQKTANFFAREEDRTASVGSNLLHGHQHEADPPPPSACIHQSLKPTWTVDVINGWSLLKSRHLTNQYQ